MTQGPRDMPAKAGSIRVSEGTSRLRRLVSRMVEGSLLGVTSLSMLAVLSILLFVTLDALPYFKLRGLGEFFTHLRWYPSGDPPEFGVLAIIFGSGMVTLLSTVLAIPLALFAAISLSDILPFGWRQVAKPVVEMIAAIPSVAYGFFALVIFAPLLQQKGGALLGWSIWGAGLPLLALTAWVLPAWLGERLGHSPGIWQRWLLSGVLLCAGLVGIWALSQACAGIQVNSGTNVLNVSVILAIMALPTMVSVSEDALQSVGRDLREGSYALGATRAETLVRVVLPAARSGLVAAMLLGIMRALGETMVVWMASGNAAQIPEPWYNIFAPIRTLTATIAGDMGEADHVTGSARYHVLFAMALFLLVFSFVSNLVSEWFVTRSRKRLRG